MEYFVLEFLELGFCLYENVSPYIEIYDYSNVL